MINHREKLDIINFWFNDSYYLTKKTTESGIIVKTKDDKKQVAKIDYESLRVVILAKDSVDIQDVIEYLKRIESKFIKDLGYKYEFTVV